MNTLGDNCPACITEDCAVTCYPVLTVPDGDEGVRATYRCPECRHQWWTSWAALGEDVKTISEKESAA